MNTINNVPRELLEDCKTLAWQTHIGRIYEPLHALLSAQSPAGVDGLEVVAYVVDDDAVMGECIAFKGGSTLLPGTELVRLSDAMRAIAKIQGECELLRKFKIAYNEWQDKTDWVQQTATAKELGRHRADVLRDRLSGWIARMNQPYDDADIDARSAAALAELPK